MSQKEVKNKVTQYLQHVISKVHENNACINPVCRFSGDVTNRFCARIGQNLVSKWCFCSTSQEMQSILIPSSTNCMFMWPLQLMMEITSCTFSGT